MKASSNSESSYLISAFGIVFGGLTENPALCRTGFNGSTGSVVSSKTPLGSQGVDLAVNVLRAIDDFPVAVNHPRVASATNGNLENAKPDMSLRRQCVTTSALGFGTTAGPQR